MMRIHAKVSSIGAMGLAAILTFVATAAAGDEAVPRFNPRCEAAPAKNLIRNASFECGGDLWLSLGKSTAWGGDLSGLYGAIESGGAYDGAYCLRIDLGPGVTPVTCFDAWPPAYVQQHAPLAANVGWMAVTRGQPITLSAYMRSSVAGTKAKFLFRFAKSALDPIQEAAHIVTLTADWARYTVTQEALADDVCIAAGPDMTERPDTPAQFWIDAIQLESGVEATAFETREPVELGITTAHYGNVYEQSEPVVFTIHAQNRGAQDVTVLLKIQLEDYFGSAVLAAERSLAIPGGGQIAAPWEIPVPGKGHFRANITWNANGGAHARTLAMCVIAPYPHADSPFGVNHPAPSEAQLRLLSKGGVRWVRDWAVNWEWVEPKQGQISWAAQDQQIDYLRSAGMIPLIVFPNPSTNWNSSAPESVENTLWYRLAYAPKEPERLFGVIGAAVKRYGQACTYYEFLNEPLWVPDFCLPEKGGYTVADYVRLLEGAYRAIKFADPNAQVIGGLAIEPRLPKGDEFIAAGGLKFCDIYNLHPYGGRMLPEEFIQPMERIQNAMAAAGQRAPIWATETGYYAVDDKPWSPWVVPPGHFSAGLLLSSERIAADYLVRHAIILLANGTAKIFYHEPIEGPANNGAMDIENPFLGQHAEPKKTFAAISALANTLGPAPRYVGRLDISGEDSAYGFAFQCDARAVLAAWAVKQEGASKAIELSAPNESQAFDVMGNAMRTQKVVLSESPAYIESATLTAEALLAACSIRSTAP